MPNQEVQTGAFPPTQAITQSRHNHMLDVGLVNHFNENTRKILNHENALRARIFQLMFQFAGRVKRIAIHYDEPQSQASHEGDWVLQDVRHHEGEAITLLEAVMREMNRKSRAQPIQLTIGDVGAAAMKGDAVGVLRQRFLNHFRQIGVCADIDFRRDRRRVFLKPRLGSC